MAKQYNSFEEIDAQLKIIELRKEISKEYMKLEIGTLKNLLNPKNWIRSFETGFSGADDLTVLDQTLKKKIA